MTHGSSGKGTGPGSDHVGRGKRTRTAGTHPGDKVPGKKRPSRTDNAHGDPDEPEPPKK